uniref:Uncharacterized protein n=1 Tax=Arion vulgaris TaxID=1028688 RepID=A0A0B7B578_9EUPU
MQHRSRTLGEVGQRQAGIASGSEGSLKKKRRETHMETKDRTERPSSASVLVFSFTNSNCGKNCHFRIRHYCHNR